MHRGFERDDLMAILDGVDDAVVKLDGKSQFVAMNQAAISIYQRLGLDPQQMKGKSVWDIFPDLKGTIVEREIRSVIEEHRQISFEFYYTKDQRWYETKGYSVPPGAVLVFRDISNKKAAPTNEESQPSPDKS
jgi:PAS domain S-box-containing protein